MSPEEAEQHSPMPVIAADLRSQSCLEESNRSLQSEKRKEPEPLENTEVEELNQQKKPKSTCNVDFHNMVMESRTTSGLYTGKLQLFIIIFLLQQLFILVIYVLSFLLFVDCFLSYE